MQVKDPRPVLDAELVDPAVDALVTGKLDVLFERKELEFSVTPEMARMQVQVARAQYVWPMVIAVGGWFVAIVLFLGFLLLVGHFADFDGWYPVAAALAGAIGIWPLSRLASKLIERLIRAKDE